MTRHWAFWATLGAAAALSATIIGLTNPWHGAVLAAWVCLGAWATQLTRAQGRDEIRAALRRHPAGKHHRHDMTAGHRTLGGPE